MARPDRAGPLVFALVLAACGTSVEREPGAGGGDSEPSGASGGGSPSSSSSTGGEGTTGSGGGDVCEPYDQVCNCAECDGTCLQACNFTADWTCYEPGPPSDDEFSCGGFLNCGKVGQACIHISPVGDGCVDFFCADVPDACQGEPSCDCLAPYVDEQLFEASCREGDGVEITLGATSARPPWDRPACGLDTCLAEENETCWHCIADGGATETNECAPGMPDIPDATCTIVWGSNG